MVSIQDASVPLAGTVVGVEDVTKYETGEHIGLQFTIMAAGGGFALLRIMNEDLTALGRDGLVPSPGQQVGVLARPSAWSQERGAGNMRYRYVRLLTVSDLDQIGAAIAKSEPAKV
jgi:hypothetical protein